MNFFSKYPKYSIFLRKFSGIKGKNCKFCYLLNTLQPQKNLKLENCNKTF